MPVDNCPHSFDTLAGPVLPRYMEQLRLAMKTPRKAAELAKPGSVPVAIAKAVGRPADFSGCYVMLENSKSVYVGIPRSVLSCLRQHVTGKSHFDATLVYAVAKRKLPTKGHRSKVMEHASF